MTEPGTKPFWAKCRKCAHCWIIAYLPMDIETMAKAAKRATCPKCGDTKPVIARQSDGVLLEEAEAE